MVTRAFDRDAAVAPWAREQRVVDRQLGRVRTRWPVLLAILATVKAKYQEPTSTAAVLAVGSEKAAAHRLGLGRCIAMAVGRSALALRHQRI